MPLIAILDDRLTNRNIYARLATSLEEGTEVVTFDDPRSALDWLGRNDTASTASSRPGPAPWSASCRTASCRARSCCATAAKRWRR